MSTGPEPSAGEADATTPQARAEPVAAQDRYRLLAESATDIVSRQRPDGTVLWTSPSLRSVLGLDPDDERNRAPDTEVHPDDRAALDAALACVAAGQGPQTVTHRSRHVDGTWRWLETTVRGLHEDGRLTEVHRTSRDATARVESALALAETGQRYRALVEQMPDGIMLHVDGRVVFANASAARLLAADSAEQLLGVPALELIGPDSRQAARARLATLLQGGTVPVLRHQLLRLDGTEVTADVSGSLVQLDGQRAVQNVLRDVTAEQRAEAVLCQTQQEHTTLFERSPVGIARADATGLLVLVNDAFATLLGRPAEQLVGMAMRELSASAPGEVRVMDRLLAGEDTPCVERTFLRPDGTRVQAAVTAAAQRRADGALESLVLTAVDVTERNRATAALEASVVELEAAREAAEQRTALLDGVLDSIDVGVVACDAAGRPTLVNRASRQFHGLPPEPDLDPARWSELFTLRSENGLLRLEPEQVPLHRALTEGHVRGAYMTIRRPDELDRVVRCDGKALSGQDGAVLGAVVALKDVTELRVLRADSSPVWCEVATTTAGSTAGRPYVLAQLLDIDARKTNELALERAAGEDPLTGLGNRTVLDRELTALLDPAAGGAACVLFIDLDGFKRVNDSQGHDAGDAVLMELAGRLRAALRPGDTAVRTGGDEFVLACSLRGPDRQHARAAASLAGRIERALAQPVLHHGVAVCVSASIGLAVSRPGEDAASLVVRADRAMYERKAERRRQVTTTGVPDGPVARTEADRTGDDHVRTTLRTAVAQDRLRLHYQPVVDVRTGQVVGTEALMRLVDTSGQLLAPDRFIPVAEADGSIAELGRWALREALSQTHAWKQLLPPDREFGIGVNISPDASNRWSAVAPTLNSSQMPV